MPLLFDRAWLFLFAPCHCSDNPVSGKTVPRPEPFTLRQLAKLNARAPERQQDFWPQMAQDRLRGS